MRKDPLQLINSIAQTVYDKKGFNILALDVRGVSTMTDYFLIAEGSVEKHLTALGKAVIQRLKQEGELPIHIEGLSEGDWVVVDCGKLVIHLFIPSMRDKYRLEALWQEGKVVDLGITVLGESHV
ncbi:MAG: Ribosomal silencing factor RsfS [Chlamydiae bacterium]|nr:Ribosomal silencing factor RsfS [Chlamydiota bacterium]